MWKRGEVVRPPDTGREARSSVAPGAPGLPSVTQSHLPVTEVVRHMDRDAFSIGKSVVFKGELSGSEDLVVEGTVEGKIELREHVLTVGAHGKIRAEVNAKVVIVLGEVVGNVTASEKLDIRNSGSVEGDIAAPVVSIAEGAHLRGSVDMQKTPAGVAAPAQAPKLGARPAPLPAGSPASSSQRLAGA